MFLELIATFVAGIGAAGLVLILNAATRGRLPRWLIPAAAGAAMIGVAIWSESTWAARTAEGLPEGVIVAETIDHSAWWRPWTYLWPQVTRLMALDTGSLRQREDAPDLRLADLYFFARWQPPMHVPQLIRCTDPARANVTGAALNDPATADWHPLPGDSGLAGLACKE